MAETSTRRNSNKIRLACFDRCRRGTKIQRSRTHQESIVQSYLKLLKGKGDRNAAELIVVATEQTGAAVTPVTVLKLSRDVKAVTAIDACRQGGDVIQTEPAFQLAVWTYEFEPSAEHSLPCEIVKDFRRGQLSPSTPLNMEISEFLKLLTADLIQGRVARETLIRSIFSDQVRAPRTLKTRQP
jgi:hypothetical protein